MYEFFFKLKTEFSNVINTLNLIGNNIDNFKKRVKTAIIFAFFFLTLADKLCS